MKGKKMLLKTYKERMELIAKLAPKYNRLANMIREAERDEPKTKPRLYDSENINHYTDAPEYAREYYGDKYRDTINTDNDWGNY